MMEPVRCRVKLVGVARCESAGADGFCWKHTFHFVESAENTKAAAGGALSVTTTKQQPAWDIGKEFYLDISKVPAKAV